MGSLDKRSKIILSLGPIFLVFFCMFNISPKDKMHRLNNLSLPEGSDLFIDSLLTRDTPIALELSNHLKYLYDTTGKLTFEDIASGPSSFGPKQAKFHLFHADNIWMRLDLKSGTIPTTWYLGTASKTTEYFTKTNQGLWQKDTVGTDIKNSSNLFHIVSNPFIQVDLPSNSDVTLILKPSPRNLYLIGNNQLWRFSGVLANQEYIYEHQIARLKEQFPVIFILFVVMIYHLILYFFNKEVSYLLLGLSALANIINIAYDNDFLFQLFESRNIGFFGSLSAGVIYSSQLIVIPFIISYLKISYRSFVSKLLWAWVCFILIYWIIFYILSWAGNDALVVLESTQRTYPIIILSTNLIILTVIIDQLLKKNSNATYLLVGYGTICIGNILTVFFHLSYFSLEFHNLPIAMGYLFFAFGLSHSFKQSQDREIEASLRAISADQQNQINIKEADRLRELNQFKSQLYTNITHEFRTPLTVISGMADQLPRDSQAKELINRNADQLLDLVNQMLDLSKIDAGKLVPVISQMDIIPILKYYSEGYVRFATSKDKHFQLELMDDVVWMDIDPDLLGRICHNLVHNAIKFSPQNGQVKMRVEKVEDGQKLQLTISDQGRGIPVADIDRIFDRFYQVDTSNTRHGEGTGIGLALVKEITQLLNGTILVDSKEHIGSTFTVTLPIENSGEIIGWSPGSKRNHDNFTTMQKENGQPSTAFKILIVEDHSDVRAYLTQLINDTYHVDQADNGRTGLSLAFDLIPDLIISDVMMPEIDGFKFCETIKKDPRTSHIPVILLTAKSTQEDKLDGILGGADAYLVKPFDKRELFLRIEKLLEHREKVRQYYQQFQMLPQEEIKENKFLQKVRNEIEANLSNEQYQIEELAQGVHLGRVQLYRKLKALTGKSYTQLLREMRISRAKDLLKKTDKTTSEIAFEVGFKDRSYFGKVFKKEVGMNASEFRSQIH